SESCAFSGASSDCSRGGANLVWRFCKNGMLALSKCQVTDSQISNDREPTSPTPLPSGERPQSRASEIAGEGSCYTNSAPHPVFSLRSQTTLSPAGRGSECLVGSMSLH